MPTYQYACPDCGFEFEKQQKFTDDPVKRCPNCGKKHVYRVVSKVAVTFKGSGWYITDSKSDKAKHTVETKHEDKDGVDKAETKTETKEAAKAETATEASSASKSDKTGGKSDSSKKPSPSKKKSE